MINRIEISGINYKLEEDIKRYVRRKIGRLDRFVPRRTRGSLHVEVKLKEANEKHGNKYECEAVFHLPEEQLCVSDSTMNMFAAIDIVEEKMKNSLRKYKDKHATSRKGGGLLGRFKRSQTAQIEPRFEEV